VTREELLVTVLAVTAGQGLDKWLDVLTVVLCGWAMLAVLAGAVAWRVSRA